MEELAPADVGVGKPAFVLQKLVRLREFAKAGC